MMNVWMNVGSFRAGDCIPHPADLVTKVHGRCHEVQHEPSYNSFVFVFKWHDSSSLMRSKTEMMQTIVSRNVLLYDLHYMKYVPVCTRC